MQLFTVTFQSGIILENFSNDDYEQLTLKFYKKFQTLLVQKKLDSLFEVEAYWRKGCIVIDYVLHMNGVDDYFKDVVKNKINEDNFRTTEKYKQLKEILEQLTYDFFNQKVLHNEIELGIYKLYVSCNNHRIHPNSRKVIDFQSRLSKAN